MFAAPAVLAAGNVTARISAKMIDADQARIQLLLGNTVEALLIPIERSHQCASGAEATTVWNVRALDGHRILEAAARGRIGIVQRLVHQLRPAQGVETDAAVSRQAVQLKA